MDVAHVSALAEGDMERDILGDRYELQRTIGHGGMADVWVGRDTALGREVAIKILHSGYASDPRSVERFRREAQAAARLNHPNIAAVYDWGEIRSPVPGYYIVMQLVHGEDLREVIRHRGPLPETEALEIAAQVAAALEAAHQQGLVHRDVKPHNILIDESGNVAVVDFGIVHASGVSQLTQTGTVTGTPRYLSPEQAQHLPIDGRSDLYSLGVVLYEMLAGRPPFAGDSIVELALQHMRDTPVPPREIRPSISDASNAIVMKALAKDPNDRFGSAAEMRGALLSALSASNSASDDTAPNPVIEPRPTSVPAPAREPVAAMAAGPRVARAQPRPIRRAAAPTASRRPVAPPTHRGLSPLLLLVPLLLLIGAGALALSTLGGSGNHAAGGGSPRATLRPSHVVGGGAATRGTPTSKPTSTGKPTRVAAVAPRPTATPAPTDTAAAAAHQPANTPGGAGSPVASVDQFYTDVAYHNWSAAESLWSSDLIQSCPPVTCINQRFANTAFIAINAASLHSQSGSNATVNIDLTETLDSGKADHYVGEWYLVKGSGGWLLERPSLSVAAATSGAQNGPPTPPRAGKPAPKPNPGPGKHKAKGHAKKAGDA
jgi:hypothetical protein